jgi:tRNA dimethylallyltransferase
VAARPAICLMGPTASGKTGLSLALADAFPVDLISVDSALVYRGMDIGTAKPSRDVLSRYPHALVDILDPAESWSAGAFLAAASEAMEAAWLRGRIPLLVGGTMLYFRALRQGLAALPPGDPDVRAALDAEGARSGWPALHERLRAVDPAAAAAISASDRQRIQRALEVWTLTGRPISALQADSASGVEARYCTLALHCADRPRLHARIAERFDAMLAAGFVAEVARLHARGDLSPELPSLRAVGYRQVWAHLEGKLSLEQARYRGIVATRQLAKRQMTWLRAEAGLSRLAVDEPDLPARANEVIRRKLGL